MDLQRVLIASRDPRGLSLDMLSLATFLYENEEKTGPRLAIAAEFTSDELFATPPWQQLRGLVASGRQASRRAEISSETQTRCPAWPFVGALWGQRGCSAV